MKATMHTVESSNIESIGYNEGNLYVKFHSGSTYQYSNVPEDVYVQFCNAESKGKFLNANIKEIYIYSRI